MRSEEQFTARGLQARGRILAAATELIAAQGYHNTSVDEIVAAAGVNKRMVYHYFGSKEALCRAVLRAEYARLSAQEVAAVSPADPIEKVIPAIVRAYFTFLKTNTVFVRLLLWENLNYGRLMAADDMPIAKGPVLELLEQAVRHAQRAGCVRREVNVKLLLISLIGNCMVYFSNQYTLHRALGLSLTAPGTLRRAQPFIAKLILRGILTDQAWRTVDETKRMKGRL